jgi:hypothetical protein
MSSDKKPTPIPPAVQAKMEQGQRQRYAMATAPSVAPPSKTKGVRK